jgi:hypothetical protein
MFTTVGYYEEFLDLLNWGYKCHYTILTESRLQCVVMTGRNYEILSKEQKRGKMKDRHIV